MKPEPNSSPVARVASALSAAKCSPRPAQGGFVARCPVPGHGQGRGDRNPSLKVSEGVDGRALMHCHAECDTEDVVAALGLQMTDLYPACSSPTAASPTPSVPRTATSNATAIANKRSASPADRVDKHRDDGRGAVSKTCDLPACERAREREGPGTTCTHRYDYPDAAGVLVGQVHRWEPKTFRPFTPAGDGSWKLGGSIPPIPYALPRALSVLGSGGTVLIVEGEKDADTINKLGRDDLAATTNAGGAGKWTSAHTQALATHLKNSAGQVIVVGDNDDPGRDHANKVADTFIEAGLPRPRVVFPSRGKDVTDHLDAGGDLTLGSANGLIGSETVYTRLAASLSVDDLARLPTIRPAIEGYLSTPSAALLVGAYGAGKSAVTLSAALSVATGTPFLGHDVIQTRALYVAGEGVRGLHRRTLAWQQSWNRDIPENVIRFMPKLRGSLKEEATWRELTAFCRGEGIGFVALDTLSALAPDADETKDAPTIVDGLNQLAEDIQGTAVLVHHPGWASTNQNRARGGYQLEANVDEVLTLQPISDGSDHITVTIKKRKDGESGAVHYLRRVTVPLLGPDGKPLIDDKGDQATSITVEHSRRDEAAIPIRDRILGYLTDSGDLGASPRDIAAEIGANPSHGAFKKALNALTSEGAIRRDGKTTSTRYYLM